MKYKAAAAAGACLMALSALPARADVYVYAIFDGFLISVNGSNGQPIGPASEFVGVGAQTFLHATSFNAAYSPTAAVVDKVGEGPFGPIFGTASGPVGAPQGASAKIEGVGNPYGFTLMGVNLGIADTAPKGGFSGYGEVAASIGTQPGGIAVRIPVGASISASSLAMMRLEGNDYIRDDAFIPEAWGKTTITLKVGEETFEDGFEHYAAPKNGKVRFDEGFGGQLTLDYKNNTQIEQTVYLSFNVEGAAKALILPTIPEPSTYALMLSGIAALAFAVRRGRR